MNRSLALDLLFDDTQVDRVNDIHSYLEEPDCVDRNVALHRVTVFLTYGCNLDCPYCKTIARNEEELRLFPQKAETFNIDTFRAFLLSINGTPVHHLHFTGGEPAIVRDLARMVCLAKKQRVSYCSMTSNGTLPLKIYTDLVECGMDEIRISLDASEPEMGRLMSGNRHNAWRRAVETIQGLAALREKYPQFFMLVNAVISETNRHDIVNIVRFILELGVGDLRLLSVAAQKETLWDFPGAREAIHGIKALLMPYDSNAFPLLRKKLQSVFAPEEIGLKDAKAPDGKEWRCYVPLTERTVDSTFYYPCSTYLREGGKPLGMLSDTFDMQLDKTADFTHNFRPLADPLCVQYCSHCTKTFNILANNSRS